MRTAFVSSLTLLMLVSIAGVSIAHDYYPLALGNVWFYRSVSLPPSDSTIGGSVRVVGDSLFSNGRRYFVLSQNDIMGSKYVRTDSTSVFYVNPYTGQDQQVFRINGRIGDTTWIGWGPYGYARLASIDTPLVFGQRRRMITFQLEGILYAQMRFCESLGPITEWRYSDPPPPWPEWGRELVGCIINGIGYGHTLDVPERTLVPKSFELYQNYPNPFNPVTNFQFQIVNRQLTILKVYDVLGREVVTLVNEEMKPGQYERTFDASGLASGVYFYRLSAGDVVQTKKLIFLR